MVFRTIYRVVGGSGFRDVAVAGFAVGTVVLLKKVATTVLAPLDEPEILPIYDEKDELIGFTHPTLVKTAENSRAGGA